MAHYHYATNYLAFLSANYFNGPLLICRHHYFHQSYDRHHPSSCDTSYYSSVKNQVSLNINYFIHLCYNLFIQIYLSQYYAFNYVQMHLLLLNYAFDFHEQRKVLPLPSYQPKLYQIFKIYGLSVLSFLFLQFFNSHGLKHYVNAYYSDFIVGQMESFRIFSEKELSIFDLIIYHRPCLVS